MSDERKPTGEACPKCGNDKLVFRVGGHPKFDAMRTCRCCGELFAIPVPPDPAPPRATTPEPMSEERLAEIRRLPIASVYTLRELLAEVDRLRTPLAAPALESGELDLPESLEAYRLAPSGVGPLAAQWADKPHRLVYDLVRALAAISSHAVPPLNQCDGCRRGLPLVDGIHRGDGYDMIGCTAARYTVDASAAALTERATRAETAIKAWAEYAYHAEGCVELAQTSWENCFTCSQLRGAALGAELASLPSDPSPTTQGKP